MKRVFMRTCKRCGAEVTGRSNKIYCSINCKSADAVTRWRRNLKLKAIEYKGGKCNVCGYKKCPAALEFHHPEDDKEFGLAQKGTCRAWEKVKKELDKCDLVCKNCHTEIHCGG
jgi:hypothetical protein